MSGAETVNRLLFPNLPVVGETYTIREIAPNGQLWLKEITNPQIGYAEGTFSLYRFVDLETGKSLQSGDAPRKIIELCLFFLTPKGFLVFLGIMALFFAIVGNNHNEASSNNSNTTFESPSRSIPSQQAIQTPATTGTDNTKSSAVIFTSSSNGYDWEKADYQTKQQFCQTTAAAESKEFNHDFTADFYYSALDSFYSSSDPNILNENIHQVIGLTTSAALTGQ